MIQLLVWLRQYKERAEKNVEYDKTFFILDLDQDGFRPPIANSALNNQDIEVEEVVV